MQAADGGLDFRVIPPTASPSEQSTSTGKLNTVGCPLEIGLPVPFVAPNFRMVHFSFDKVRFCKKGALEHRMCAFKHQKGVF